MKKINDIKESSSKEELQRPLTRGRSGGQPPPAVRGKEVHGVRLSREEKELIEASKASSSSSDEEPGSPYDDDEDYQDSVDGSVEPPAKR